MVAAMVYNVNVVPDWFDMLSLVAGFGGFAVAVVALRQAARTERKANHAIADERRRQFELEILGELTKDLDAGMPHMVFINPKYLQQYATRLNLIDPRLERWDDIVALDDYREVAAYVGMSSLTNAERERTELLEDISGLQSATQSLRPIRLEEETWKSQEQQGLIDPEDRALMIGRRQHVELTQRVLGGIVKWLPDPPLWTDVQAWNVIDERLKQTLSDLEAMSIKNQEDVVRLRAETEAELQRILTWDVDQAIRSRVEARHFERRRRWRRQQQIE